MRRLKARSHDLLLPRHGVQLLDLGCGTGDDVRALATRVGVSGRVVGVDASEVMIKEARRRWRSEDSDLPIEFLVAKGHSTGLSSNSFDGCRAERLLVHLENPVSTLSEMVRLVKTGAPIVILDSDWETLVIDSQDRVVTRKLIHFFCDIGKSRWIGRQLRGLLVAAGLRDTSVSAETMTITDLTLADRIFKLRETTEQATAFGVLTTIEAHRWLGELQQSDELGRFFAALTVFCVCGFKR